MDRGEVVSTSRTDAAERLHAVVAQAYERIDKYSFLQDVIACHRELLLAENQFNQVSDPHLIDTVVFRLGAAERRLDYLFRIARELTISFDGVEFSWRDAKLSNSPARIRRKPK